MYKYLYFFRTSATMKPHNSKKWWIDKDIISEKHIQADSIIEALKKYQDIVWNQHYIKISDNAIKTRNPMYCEFPDRDKQIGYVLTASTDFQKDDGTWTKQQIDLWVEILTIVDTEFPEDS